MTRSLTRAALVAVASCLSAQQPEQRTWTDVSGRTIQAEFLSADAEKVVVRMNGNEFGIPLARLSSQDVAWVKSRSIPSAPVTSPALDAGSPMRVGGAEVKANQRIEFEIPVPETIRKRGDQLTTGFEEYADADMTKALVGLFVPPAFDPAKTWPVMIVSVTNSGRDKGRDPSSVKSMGGYLDAAREHGWVVLAADCPGYKTPGSPFNRSALVEAALEALGAQWPTSKDWPLATGGFSGGAKYSGWIAGWMCERGRRVVGIFMGGCNEDTATSAIKTLKPDKKIFTAAKVFLSTGKADNIAGPEDTAKVMDSLKSSGFEVQESIHQGGHTLDRAHVAEAMKWFMTQ